jgi:hypothetical protein
MSNLIYNLELIDTKEKFQDIRWFEISMVKCLVTVIMVGATKSLWNIHVIGAPDTKV